VNKTFAELLLLNQRMQAMEYETNLGPTDTVPYNAIVNI